MNAVLKKVEPWAATQSSVSFIDRADQDPSNLWDYDEDVKLPWWGYPVMVVVMLVISGIDSILDLLLKAIGL